MIIHVVYLMNPRRGRKEEEDEIKKEANQSNEATALDAAASSVRAVPADIVTLTFKTKPFSVPSSMRSMDTNHWPDVVIWP